MAQRSISRIYDFFKRGEFLGKKIASRFDSHKKNPDRAVTDSFDPEFYKKHNPDVVDSGMDIFEHYRKYGQLEGRVKSAKEWHDRQSEIADGRTQEAVRQLLMILNESNSRAELTHINRFVVAIFSSNHYKNLLDDGVNRSYSELLAHYVLFGIQKGISPGPLFDSEFYLSQLKELNLTADGIQVPLFEHWLTYGTTNRINPCPIFVEKDYLDFNSDLSEYPGWLFEHFVFHGISEGRRFNACAWFPARARNHLTAPATVNGTQQFLDYLSSQTAPSTCLKQIHTNHTFFNSQQMKKIFSNINLIEPEIGGIDQYTRFALTPPWHDPDYFEFTEMQDKIPKKEYEYIILMPFCKMGGADYVGGILSQVLSKNSLTLIIRTDQSEWDRPDWFAGDADTIDLSNELNRTASSQAIRILYEIVQATSATHIINVNSFRAFQLFERFGKQLSLTKKLYAYYFCADRDDQGNEVGYPISFFSQIFPNLTAAFTDNEELRLALLHRYSLDDSDGKKIKTIYTPAASDVSSNPIWISPEHAIEPTRRKKIIWAGRFDRQKRFDLLVDIAEKMPEIDFLVWGKAVLDKERSYGMLPYNIIKNGTFRTLSELPLDSCAGWLYTSSWDGLPTILIECGAFGVPIVASDVGGVSELISEKTGWLVRDVDNVGEYVSAVRDMISNHEERLIRSRQLQQLVKERHNVTEYDRSILSAMGKN